MSSDEQTKGVNITLDDHLVDKGLRLTGIKTRNELIDFALRELVRHVQRKRLLSLKGRIDRDGDRDARHGNVVVQPWPDAR